MVFLVVLIFTLMMLTPLTLEMKITPKDNDCRHVLLTTWFGNIKHINAEVCGDQKVHFMGREIPMQTPKSEMPR